MSYVEDRDELERLADRGSIELHEYAGVVECWWSWCGVGYVATGVSKAGAVALALQAAIALENG